MRPYCEIVDRLRTAGLRPTRQRLALARLMTRYGHRHVTAEELFHEARADGVNVSLATVYNTLNQFTDAGLLREVAVDMGQSYFDTNVDHHHHFFDPTTGELSDIPDDAVELAKLPQAPAGMVIDKVEVIVRLKKDGAAAD